MNTWKKIRRIKMKIILIKDHKDLGKSGDLINAKDGYARNFLIPMKIAIEATKENLAKWQEEKRIEEENEKENRKQALELKKKLESKKILITAKAGDGGKLFGAITSKDIADQIKKHYNVQIDKKKIDLAENIKSIGIKNIEIKLYPKIVANIKVEVDGE